MSERYTRKDATVSAHALTTACGRNYGYEEGSWNLDYNSANGGYLLVEYLTGGGEHCPLGHRRRSASEFCSAVSFALSALYECRSGIPA